MSVANLVIRRGAVSDAALLAELGASTFSETFARYNSAEDMAAYLAEAFSPAQQTEELSDPKTTFLIAAVNNAPAGYAMLRPNEPPPPVPNNQPIELVRLYVTRASIGSGVGAALMQACIEEARQGGFKTLFLGVWEHNARAQSFYRKWGFQQAGTHIFQLGDDPQTDFLMHRPIE